MAEKVYGLAALPWRYVVAAVQWFYALQPALLPSSYTIVAPRTVGGPMPKLNDLPSIAPTQVQTCAIDFGNFLPSGVTLTGTPTIRITLRSGTDASPQSRLVGGPTVGTAAAAIGGTGIANAAILFQIGGCVGGAVYTIETYCTRSDSDVAEGWTRLTCDAPS